MDRNEVKKKAGEGARWSALFSVVSIATQVTQVTVLAILLDVADFGLRGYTVFAIGMLQVVVEFGVGMSIVKEKEISRTQLNTIFLINLLLSLCVFVGMYYLSPAVASALSEPELTGLLRTLAVVLLITPVGVIYIRLLERHLLLRVATIIEIISTVCGVASTIGLALANYGVYSLIYGQLIQEIVRAIGLCVTGYRYWRPGVRFSFKSVGRIYRIGLFQLGESLIYYISANIDRLILGFLLGTEGLGYYVYASGIISQPHSKLNPIVNRVALPIFSKIQDDLPTLRRAYLRIVAVFSFLSLPAVLGFAGVASHLIPAIVGTKWSPAIPLFLPLGLVFMLKTIVAPSGPLGQVKNRVHWTFYSNLIVVALQFPVFFIGARLGGMVGVAMSAVVLQLTRVSLFHATIVKYSLPITLRDITRSVLPFALAALAMFLALRVIAIAVPVTVGGVILLVAIGAVIYGVSSLLFFRETLHYLKGVVFHRYSKKQQ